jgi:uncharacterized protein (TIGR03086 family)
MDESMMQAICDATERVVADIEPRHHDLATPCVEWTVRDLANHLLATLELGRALLADEMPTVEASPGALPARDLVGDDLLGAYRQGAKALVAATTVDAVGRSHATPLGDMPGAGLAGFAGLDVLVHGWDLATAIGRDATLERSLAEPMLAFARQTISDEMGTRAPRIGPEVPVPDAADATARLVGYLGRSL